MRCYPIWNDHVLNIKMGLNIFGSGEILQRGFRDLVFGDGRDFSCR
jgi:hypothetical protein